MWPLVIILIAYWVNLAVHGLLGTYSRFIADDFCSAGMAHRFGVLRAVWYWYLNWTGRYTASTLDAIFGLLGPSVTPLVAPLVLAAWVAVVAYTLVASWEPRSPQGLPTAVVLAVALICTTLGLSPNVPQSLYWGQGMRSIVSPLILAALYVDLLLWYRRPATSPLVKKALLLAGSVLAFVVGGLNETFTALELSALMFAVLLILFGGRWQTGRTTRNFLLGGVLGAAVAFAAVIGAPGNAFRQAYYPPPPNLAGILNISLSSFGAFWTWLAGTAERWAAVTGAAALAAYVGSRRAAQTVSWWRVALPLVIGLAFSYLCFLPAAYGLSDTPPERTLMIPAFVLVVALMLAAFSAGQRVGQGFAEKHRRSRFETAILALALAAVVASTTWSDVRLLASQPIEAQYAAHWDATNAQIIAARSAGAGQVWIQSMQNWADLNEPNDNPKFWVNVCYEEYYGIRVLAEGPP